MTKTITNNGNATASGAESNFYDGSFYFDGTGDYIITTADTDEMVINFQDFTLEAWIWKIKLEHINILSPIFVMEVAVHPLT